MMIPVYARHCNRAGELAHEPQYCCVDWPYQTGDVDVYCGTPRDILRLSVIMRLRHPDDPYSQTVARTLRSAARAWYQAYARNEDGVGWCWHIHADRLVEPLCEPFADRVEYIRSYYPPEEVPLRLHRFRPVAGHLPKPVIAAGLYYRRTWAAAKKLRLAAADSDQKWKSWQDALRVHVKSQIALQNAIRENMQEILKLHAQECPDCLWEPNWQSIFGKEKK